MEYGASSLYCLDLFSQSMMFAKSSQYIKGNVFLLKDSLEPTVDCEVRRLKWNYPVSSGILFYKIGLSRGA